MESSVLDQLAVPSLLRAIQEPVSISFPFDTSFSCCVTACSAVSSIWQWQFLLIVVFAIAIRHIVLLRYDVKSRPRHPDPVALAYSISGTSNFCNLRSGDQSDLNAATGLRSHSSPRKITSQSQQNRSCRLTCLFLCMSVHRRPLFYFHIVNLKRNRTCSQKEFS